MRIAKAIVALTMRQKDVVATFSSAENAQFLLHVHSAPHTLTMLRSVEELRHCEWKRVRFSKDVEISFEDGSVLYPGHLMVFVNKKEATAYLISGYKYVFKAIKESSKVMVDGDVILLNPSQTASLDI